MNRSSLSFIVVGLLASLPIVSATPEQTASKKLLRGYWSRLKEGLNCYWNRKPCSPEAQKTIERTATSVMLTLIALYFIKPWEFISYKKLSSNTPDIPYSLQCEAESATHYLPIHIKQSNSTQIQAMLNEAKDKNYMECWKNNFADYIVQAIDTALQPVPPQEALKNPAAPFDIIKQLFTAAKSIQAPIEGEKIKQVMDKEYETKPATLKAIKKERKKLASINISTYEPASLIERRSRIATLLINAGVAY